MKISAYHFASTYYLPSWQGGDVKRARCWVGKRLGYTNHLVSDDLAEVDCPKCLSLLAIEAGAQRIFGRAA